MDLSPKLRQAVKSQNSANGELTHGIGSTKVYKRVQTGCDQQMEAGSSTAEVARAFEVTPKVLYRWRDEFRHGPGNAFPGSGKPRTQVSKAALEEQFHE
jgi:hypothetical protein